MDSNFSGFSFLKVSRGRPSAMKYKGLSFPISCLLLISVLQMPVCAYAREMIVIVASYAQDDLCGRPQYLGAIQAIEESRYRNLPIKSIFLDSKRLSSAEIRKRIDDAVTVIETEHPEIILTLDDLAFSEVGCRFVGARGMYVVFSGVNRPLKFYNSRFSFLKGNTPAKNVTGVYEYLFVREQMEFLRMVLRKDGQIALLYSTDFMGEILKEQVLTELQNTVYAKKIMLFPVSDMEELLNAVDSINSQPRIIAYIPDTMSVPDRKNGRTMTIGDLVPVLTGRAKKIDLATNKAFTRAGFFGGVSVDFMHMGYQAGRLAVMLLDGFPVKRLPVENAGRYEIIINKKRMNDLSLKLDDQVLNMVDEFL